MDDEYDDPATIDWPVALVTGASRGIGRAIARLLVQQSYTVIGVSRSGDAKPPPGVVMERCDVSDVAQVERLFDRVRERYGRLHVLVNNAGISGGAAFGSDAEADEWAPILATNLSGVWACCRAARSLLVDGRGRVINISSVLGQRGAPDQLAYCAAKHGVIGLTRALARALGPRGITANAVCPGWVPTEMSMARLADLGLTEQQAVAQTPTQRVTQPSEVAALVGFLASAAAGNINGQALGIDGGSSA